MKTTSSKKGPAANKKRGAGPNNLPKQPTLTLHSSTPEESTLFWSGAMLSKYFEVSTVTGTGPNAKHTIISGKKENLKNNIFKIPAKHLASGSATFAVRGVNTIGEGPWSLPLTVTPPKPAVEEEPPKQRQPRKPLPWWMRLLIVLAILALVWAAAYKWCPAARNLFHHTTAAEAPLVLLPPGGATNDAPLAVTAPPVTYVTQVVQAASATVAEQPRPICINNAGGNIYFDTKGPVTVVPNDDSASMHHKSKGRHVGADELEATRKFELKDPDGSNSAPYVGKQFTVEDNMYPGEKVFYIADPGWQIYPRTQAEDVDLRCDDKIIVPLSMGGTGVVTSTRAHALVVVKANHMVPIQFTLKYIGKQ